MHQLSIWVIAFVRLANCKFFPLRCDLLVMPLGQLKCEMLAELDGELSHNSPAGSFTTWVTSCQAVAYYMCNYLSFIENAGGYECRYLQKNGRRCSCQCFYVPCRGAARMPASTSALLLLCSHTPVVSVGAASYRCCHENIRAFLAEKSITSSTNWFLYLHHWSRGEVFSICRHWLLYLITCSFFLFCAFGKQMICYLDCLPTICTSSVHRKDAVCQIM